MKLYKYKLETVDIQRMDVFPGYTDSKGDALIENAKLQKCLMPNHSLIFFCGVLQGVGVLIWFWKDFYGGPEGQNTTFHKTEQHYTKHDIT